MSANLTRSQAGSQECASARGQQEENPSCVDSNGTQLDEQSNHKVGLHLFFRARTLARAGDRDRNSRPAGR